MHFVLPDRTRKRTTKKFRKKITSVTEDALSHQRNRRAYQFLFFSLPLFELNTATAALFQKLIGYRRRSVKDVRPKDGIGERRHTVRKNGIQNCRTTMARTESDPVKCHEALLHNLNSAPKDLKTRGYCEIALFVRVALGKPKPIKKQYGPIKTDVYCLRVSLWNSKSLVLCRDARLWPLIA